MLYALTAAQAREAEERAIAEPGLRLADLMDRAGAAVAEHLETRVPDGPVVVLAGPGNNGGDGWVAARRLHEIGRDVIVLSLRDPAELKGIAAEAANAARGAGVRWEVPSPVEVAQRIAAAAAVVDALLGIGSTGALRDPLSSWVEALAASDAFVLAVDAPTGVDADTGSVTGPAVEADMTVTFSAPKRGLVLYPGAAYTGELVVVDIGIPERLLHVAGAPEVWSVRDCAALLPLPAPDAHKYERGEVLVVAGSRAYAGAAALAAWGAQRSGAGYVRIAVPDVIRPTIQTLVPSAVTVGLRSDGEGAFDVSAAESVAELARRADAVAIGPGITEADGARAVLEAVLATPVPAVVDASALNLYAGRGAELGTRRAPTVLTPHAGELARLLGTSASEVQADRVSSCAKLAGDHVTVVLKGAGTVIAGAGRVVINTTGTPALATAGTGDVLSGVIAALMGSGLSGLDAAGLGTWLHGRAGEFAADAESPLSVVAEDVPAFLADAIVELLGARDPWR